MIHVGFQLAYVKNMHIYFEIKADVSCSNFLMTALIVSKLYEEVIY